MKVLLKLKEIKLKIIGKIINVPFIFVPNVIEKIKNNLKYKGKYSLKDKFIWLKRGFFLYEVEAYNLNDDNYKKYISNLQYARLYSLNKNSLFIDDKLTTKYVLQNFNNIMPKYYYIINKKLKFEKLLDLEDNYTCDYDSFYELLKEKRVIALKKISGSLGDGFYKLEFKNNMVLVNNEICTDLKEFLKNKLDGYIVTEYLKPHKDLAKIWADTSNTIRVTAVKYNNHSYVTNSFIRFGRKKSGTIDNASSGGIVAIVDIKDGTFSKATIKENKKTIFIDKHPDNNILIEGKIPFWKDICEKITQILDFLPQCYWCGFDVVVTENDFKILEVNSHQDIYYYQIYYPMLDDGISGKFLKEKLDIER